MVTSILKECHTQPYLFDFSISVNQAFELWCSMYRHIIYNHYNPDTWLITSYESVLSGLARVRLESFSGTKLDFSFPQIELNRSHGDYQLNDDCAFVYETLTRLERDHD